MDQLRVDHSTRRGKWTTALRSTYSKRSIC